MDDDLHALSGAYAVHALPYAERVLFDRHLRTCEGCGTEVRRLRETAARLAGPLAEPPPPSLRARLLATAPTHRPPTSILPPSPGPRPSRRGRRRAVGGRGRALAGVAAMSVAAAVAFGVVAFDARRDLEEARGRQEEVLAVLAAPDARTVRRPVGSGGTATVVVSRAGGRMVFTSSGLPELPRTRGYELWLVGPNGARPAGMLERGDGGLTEPVVAVPRDGEERVALTVEPATGSAGPTTAPILLADLPQA